MWAVVLFVMFDVSLYVCGKNSDKNIIRWDVSNLSPVWVDGWPVLEILETGVILRKNKPLDIILANYENIFLSTNWCMAVNTSKTFPVEVASKSQLGQATLIIKVKNVTDDMSTTWKCYVTHYNQANNDNIPGIFKFKIRIKGKERLNVTVGGLEIQYTMSEPTELEYDGTAEYWYKDGEYVDYVCQRYRGNDSSSGFIRLRYDSANGTKIFETNTTKSYGSVNYSATMNYDNNNDSIDCTYISRADIEYTYRTIFRCIPSNTSTENNNVMGCVIGIPVVVFILLLLVLLLCRNKRISQETSDNASLERQRESSPVSDRQVILINNCRARNAERPVEHVYYHIEYRHRGLNSEDNNDTEYNYVYDNW